MNTETGPAPLLLDTKAAARFCGVSRGHFLSMPSAGRVPLPMRLARRALWRAAEVDHWIETGYPARDHRQAMKGGRA